MTTIDFGLELDVCRQWQKKHLLDYTIQVEGKEFKVHKLVLVSISDYFKAMLCGSMKESEMDRVELRGLKAETLYKTLELIYTGQRSIVKDNVTEILGCAMYLQMPLVIKVCVQTLLDGLNIQNFLDVLSVCVTYDFSDEVEEVKRFLKSEWKAIMEYYKVEELSLHWLQLLSSSWQQSEWDLFLFIKNWIQVDVENRRLYIDSLMSQVRFPLLTTNQMKEIKDMELFMNSEGSWCKLVDQADQYHKLPIHHKISNTSEQTNIRSEPVPVVFMTSNGHPPAYICTDSLYALTPGNNWKEHKGKLTPPFLNYAPVAIEVNNFFIVCSGDDAEQRWDVFDPRTMTWSPMSKMTAPKSFFTLIHYYNKLYAIGGDHGSSYNVESLTDSVEEYSFQTGAWRAIKKLPFAVSKHAACVCDGFVYISGGYRNNGGDCTGSKDLDCLDLANGTSEKKAPMPKSLTEHKMLVMTLRNKEVIVVIDYQLKIRCYNPKNNQWFAFRPKVSSTRNLELEWSGEVIVLAKGNVVYFLNILSDTTAMCFFHQDCVKWEFSKEETAITEVYLEKFPMRRQLYTEGFETFGAIFSLNMK